MDADKLYKSTTEKTFQYDKTLPRLPVPPLNNTLNKYLDSVRPFVNAEEYAQTEKIVRDFGNGVGKDLNEKLLVRARQLPNWLEEWWEKYAYLMQRSPLIPTSNIGGPYPTSEPLWAPHSMDQITRAALFAHYNLQYWKMIRKEQLKPDKPRGQCYSMNQYRKVFSTFRIPGEMCDSLRNTFKTEQEGPPHTNYIIVLCRGRIFKMVVFDNQYEPLTGPELERKFRYIHETCQQASLGQNVATLTCDERSRWAENRERLMHYHPENKKNLEIIENAIQLMCLDERSPTNASELLTEVLGGDICNRWADSFTSIIFKNGTVAANGDHTPCDGMVGVSLSLYVILKFMECNGTWQGNMEVRPTPAPVELIFQLDNEFSMAIDIAFGTANTLVNNLQCRILTFNDYGRQYITSVNIKPDTYAQMALQLAYYHLHKKPVPTYETATTRAFYNGRTETVRSCTPEATEWVKAMLHSPKPRDEQLRLFKRAIEKHDTLMNEGKRNEGCDRHLMGLYILSFESGLSTPEIFLDPAWIKSGGNGNYILSTSFAGYTPVLGAATAMCTDGYGSFYCISPETITFSLTAWKNSKVTDIDAFQSSIRTSLQSMQQLLTKSSL